MLSQPTIKRFEVIVLLALVYLQIASAELVDPRKRVLLVYQNDGAIPSNMAFEQALGEDLRNRFGPILEFYREQLDSARFPEHLPENLARLRSKYAERNVNVVIFAGNIPTTIVSDVPVVQVDNGLPKQSLQSVYGDNAVHIKFGIDPLRIVDAAKRLQPGVRKVLLISGVSKTEHVYLDQFRHRLMTSSNLEIEAMGDASIPKLAAIVSHLPQDVIVLPISYFTDPQGQTYIPRDVLGRLAAVSTVPMYAVSDTYIGKGLIGGYVVSWAKTGHMAADAASQILHGTPASNIVLKSPGTGVYIFDWYQLKRWGLSENNLPSDSIIENKTLTIWERYRWRIIWIVALLTVQSLSIVGLLIHKYRRTQMEKALRDMTGRLLRSQDDERRRIARDLHDGTGQQLSGIALGVGQVLADFPPGHDRLRQLLQDSHIASRQALDEVRAISYALHPPILDGLGLLPALQWYLDGLQKRTDFHINLDVSEKWLETPAEIERTLFRIVQESVANALHHSGGSALSVKLYNSLKGVYLQVEDNGRGLGSNSSDVREDPISIGVGIAGMKERVRQFDGTITIDSTSNGTRVLVFVPLQ
jgi:signal transduction histidine kinase